MYGKLFTSMYDGSLYGHWQAIVTMQQFVILANEDGVVDMTPPAIAARTSIPLEIITAGIAVLEAPDQYSRNPAEEGRRIELLDEHRPWGWRIVNYLEYRHMRKAAEKREKDRIRLAAKRLAARESQNVAHRRKPSQKVANVAQVEAEAKAEAVKTSAGALVFADGSATTHAAAANGKGKGSGKPIPPCPHEKLAAMYHEALPQLPPVLVLSDARKRHLQQRWREVCMHEETPETAAVLEIFRDIYRKVGESKFLTGQVPPNAGRTKPFRANFDWIINAANFVKIVEDRYA